MERIAVSSLSLCLLLAAAAPEHATPTEHPNDVSAYPAMPEAAVILESTLESEAGEQPQMADWTIVPSGEHNDFRIGSFEDMQAQIRDPEQRRLMREQQRSSLAEQYAYAPQELGIDAPTHEKLLDILADDMMASWFGHHDGSGDPMRASLARANAETAKLDAIQNLLGEEGLDRFQYYQATLAQRGEVDRLDATLTSAEKLSADQKARLLDLLYEESDWEQSQLAARRSPFADHDFGDFQEIRRLSQLATIASNEESLQAAQKRLPRMRQRAAEFLSVPQLDALNKFHQRNLESRARLIEQQRARLSAQDLELLKTKGSELANPQKGIAAGEHTFEVSVTVDDNEPLVVTHRAESGTPVTIEAQELSVEVTPILLETRQLEVREAFFSEIGGRKSRLNTPSVSAGTFGHIDHEIVQYELIHVVAGARKGHAVRTTVRLVE